MSIDFMVQGPVAGSGGVETGAGYVAAGDTVDTVDRFSFPSDTRTTLSTGTSTARQAGAGMSNSGTAGYHAGGGTSGNVPVTTIDKFAYVDDSRTTLGTGLADTRTNVPFGFSNSGTAGYIGGGWSYTGNTSIDDIDKITFSSDSRSTLGATLSANTQYLPGMANSGTAGYTGGGYAGGANTATVDKITFSNDSKSTLGTGLSIARRIGMGMANSGVAGYFGAGYDDNYAYSSVVDKFTFSTDSRTTLGTGLSAGAQAGAGYADSSVAGYFTGGTGLGSATDKFSFADDTRSSSTTLSGSRSYMAGFANEGSLA